MAMYYLEIQVISRSSGRSATAAAAYRAADRIIDERTGDIHDYTHKQSVEHREIKLPDGMPDRFLDRSALWNAVEMSERSDSAQLAREFTMALPIELSRDEQIALARDYIKRNFVDHGMAADWAVHDPVDEITGERRNPHAHVMVTMRAWDCERDDWAPKARKEYLVRDREGREEYMSPSALKERADEGWEKVFSYKKGAGELTRSQAAERGLGDKDRTSRSPLDRKVDANDWNTVERFNGWREDWSRTQNEHLERHYEREMVREEERIYVDHRSYEEQGRSDLTPTRHMGPKVAAIERDEMKRCAREGREYEPVTDVARENAEIRERNRIAEQMRTLAVERVRELARTAREAFERVQAALERARDRFSEMVREHRERDVVRCCEEFRRAEEADIRSVELRDDLADARLSWLEQGAINAAERNVTRAAADVTHYENNLTVARAERNEINRRLGELGEHPVINRSKIRQANESLSRVEERIRNNERKLGEARTSLQDAREALAPLKEQERAAEEATRALSAEIERVEETKDVALTRAVEAYDRLDDAQRGQVDDQMHRDENYLHLDLLERSGRDREEEQIIRHEHDPERRCEKLIERINDNRGLWFDERAVSRATSAFEELDGPTKKRVISRFDGIGCLSWDDLRQQSNNRDDLDRYATRSLDERISEAVAASRAYEERSDERDYDRGYDWGYGR